MPKALKAKLPPMLLSFMNMFTCTRLKTPLEQKDDESSSTNCFFLLHLHIFEDILLPGLGMLHVTQNYDTAGKTLHLLYNIPQNLLISIPVQCSKRGSLNLWGRWRLCCSVH